MPSLRNDPTMAYYETNRRVIHLSKAKRCLDQADHFCRRRLARAER
jgi:hypothetical protein